MTKPKPNYNFEQTMDEFHAQYFRSHIQNEVDWLNKNSVGKTIVMYSSCKVIQKYTNRESISTQYQNIKEIYASMLYIHFLRINSKPIAGTSKRVMQYDLNMALKFALFIDEYIDPVDKQFLGKDGLDRLKEFVTNFLTGLSEQQNSETQDNIRDLVQQHGIFF